MNRPIRLSTGRIVTDYVLSYDSRRIQVGGVEYKLGLDCWWA